MASKAAAEASGTSCADHPATATDECVTALFAATASGRLLRDLAADFIKDTARQFGDSVLFVAPHAREASGDNAIPQMLATALAIASGGRADIHSR